MKYPESLASLLSNKASQSEDLILSFLSIISIPVRILILSIIFIVIVHKNDDFGWYPLLRFVSLSLSCYC